MTLSHSASRFGDIAFLVAVFLLAIVPALNIDRKTEVSKEEKRRLAAFPPIATNGLPNLQFGQQFEDWFQDRFWGRRKTIRLHASALTAMDGRIENDQAFGQTDGWLFLTGGTKESFGWLTYSDKQKKAILSGLRQQNKFLAQRGIRYCVLVAPGKATIYGEHAKWRFHRKGPSRFDTFFPELRKKLPYPVVWPKDALLARKKDGLLYHPDDTHWNMFGSRVAFFEVLRNLGLERHIPDDASEKEWRIVDQAEELDPSDLAKLLGMESHPRQYPVPASGQWFGSLAPEGVAIENPDAPIPMSVMIVGDSFRMRLAPWAAAYFQRSFIVHRRDYKPEMIESFHPDVVIGECVERFLERLGGFSFEKGGR